MQLQTSITLWYDDSRKAVVVGTLKYVITKPFLSTPLYWEHAWTWDQGLEAQVGTMFYSENNIFNSYM